MLYQLALRAAGNNRRRDTHAISDIPVVSWAVESTAAAVPWDVPPLRSASRRSRIPGARAGTRRRRAGQIWQIASLFVSAVAPNDAITGPDAPDASVNAQHLPPPPSLMPLGNHPRHRHICSLTRHRSHAQPNPEPLFCTSFAQTARL